MLLKMNLIFKLNYVHIGVYNRQPFNKGISGIFPDFIFPNITRENAETKISLQLMYLCNNFFVLFGKEVRQKILSQQKLFFNILIILIVQSSPYCSADHYASPDAITQ